MIIGPTEIRPVTAAAKSAAVSPLAALAGKVIEARLMMALGDGVFRFTSAENEFDLPLPKNLPPGTQVRITPQPDGTYQVTVLEEGGLPPPARPAAPALPPLNIIVRPKTPLPNLPPGQAVEARVVSNPATGTVRVAAPQGEIDLPLPQPLPAGTPVRLMPQTGGALLVSVPKVAAPASNTQAQPSTITTRPGGTPAPATPASPPPQPPVHPTVFTVKPEGAAPLLPQGQVVEARVVANSEGQIARFAGPDGEFELPLPRPLQPGTQARIVAQPNGTFVVTVRPDVARPASAPTAAPAPGTASQPTSPAVQTSSAGLRTPAPTASGDVPMLPPPIAIKPSPLLPQFPPNQIVEARVVTPPVGGLVRFTAPSGDFDLPMSQPLPPGMPVRIVPQPGGGLTVVPQHDVPDTAAARPAVSVMSPAEAVRQTAIAAIGKQDGLAKLFADIEDLPYRLNAPVPVKRAADALLQQRLPIESVAKPQDLAKAIASSGLFAERTLATLPQMQANAPADLKLALFVLRAALGSWSPVRPENVPPRGEAHLPPPSSGMPPSAQAPAKPVQPHGSPQMLNMPPEELVPRLAGETDAAIARLNLHQISSLPDDKAAAHRGEAPDARWSCEVPVNVDGRTAVFGFVIERDGRHSQFEKHKRKWRVRTAIDLPDTGAIEADVRLRGDVVNASILAERAEMVALLEPALPLLRDGLTAAGFEVESLYVRLGKGTAEERPQRHFVDRKT